MAKKKWGLGGRRPGAGRPKVPGSGVSHSRRPSLSKHQVLRVVLRVRPDVQDLRSKPCREAIAEALEAGKQRFGFRLIRHALQPGQIDLVVEVTDRRALSRGMQGLTIRIARTLNRACGRRGKVFADRYDAQPLTGPSKSL